MRPSVLDLEDWDQSVPLVRRSKYITSWAKRFELLKEYHRGVDIRHDIIESYYFTSQISNGWISRQGCTKKSNTRQAKRKSKRREVDDDDQYRYQHNTLFLIECDGQKWLYRRLLNTVSNLETVRYVRQSTYRPASNDLA